MTRPRAQLISLDATPYYHCVARCVRRAWLCGTDQYSGKNFDHRKRWLIDRLALLAEVFSIDVAAYAVMSNHYHVVLHVDTERGYRYSDDEVIQRWTRLYRGPELIQRYRKGSVMEAEKALVKQTVRRWRERLCSISWFMRCLNEYLARRANAEDGCKGRFWEARFHSQALLDEAAVLSCMAYVDLNPIRAGVARDLEESVFTSIHDRIEEVRCARKPRRMRSRRRPRLMPFLESRKRDQGFAGIPFNFRDYVDLVDWTGRIARQDKPGFISESATHALAVLGLSDEEWRLLALDIQKRSITMLNGLERVGPRGSHAHRYAA